MHIRSITKAAPEQAVNIEQVLDLIIQVVNVIVALEGLLGFSFAEIVDQFKGDVASV